MKKGSGYKYICPDCGKETSFHSNCKYAVYYCAYCTRKKGIERENKLEMEKYAPKVVGNIYDYKDGDILKVGEQIVVVDQKADVFKSIKVSSLRG